MIQILFAILAGVLTAGAPCILPLLPILLGTSAGRTSKTRPLYIMAGFVLVFAGLGVFLSYLSSHLGLNPDLLRNIAIVLLAIFGFLLVWKKPFELLTLSLGGLIDKVSRLGQARQDNWGGLVLGMTLGIIWTPCAGPVLGTILTLVATQSDLFRSLVLLTAYAVGAGVPMLGIAYGSQWLTTRVHLFTRYTVRIQQLFGVLIILLAVAMYFQWDVEIENQLTRFFPTQNLEFKLTQGADNMEKIDLANYGPAPEFVGINQWLNSDPLTVKDLRGKVVLVDFWTFSCINCIRTLPYVTRWYDTYKDQGLVVIGVHTPEFEFEKKTENVQMAINRHQIHYPVAQDNDFATWNNYSNQYWPAEYLIDQNGNVVYVHFGEGNYDHTENTIRELLGLNAEKLDEKGQDLSGVGSPEMYFGTNRLQYLVPEQRPGALDYKLPDDLKLNTFALEGQWTFDSDRMELGRAGGKIQLKFHSGKVHMVAQSNKPQKIHITVDGQSQPDVEVGESELYTLFDSLDYNDHVIEIFIPQAGFEAFTFTFG